MHPPAPSHSRNPPPRMLAWAVITLALVVAALATQNASPGSVLAVTLYKAHLMSLGGWGGYWLDRALFPYDRPHQYLEPDPPELPDPAAYQFNRPADTGIDPGEAALQVASGSAYGLAMLRRAVVVAACLICVGLGA